MSSRAARRRLAVASSSLQMAKAGQLLRVERTRVARDSAAMLLMTSNEGIQTFGRLSALREGGSILECTPKLRQGIKGPATVNGGERWWCPDKNIPVN